MFRLAYISILFAIIISLFVFVACETADEDDDNESDDDDDMVQVDAISSASPERQSSILTDGHPGYKDPACLNCHEGAHLDGFENGQCVTCHGSNGAISRPDGHDATGCIGCHTDAHPDLSFTENNCAACHKYQPSDTCQIELDYDVVVIGAGGGGLGAAALLSLSGQKVALIERSYKVGGYMTRFDRGDFSFDASLHGMGGFDEMLEKDKSTVTDFELLDILHRLDPIKCDPMYRSVYPGFTMDIPADADVYQTELKEKFPHEADGIDTLFEDLKASYQALTKFIEFSKADDPDGTLIWEVFSNPVSYRLISYMFLTLDEMLHKHISDPELVGLFSNMVTYVGLGPKQLQALYFMVMWNSYHLTGFYYPIGGSGAVTAALGDVVLENGSDIFLNTLATKIVIENGRAVQVRTKDDACFNADYVVSNANAPDTLMKLVGEQYLPTAYVSQLKKMSIGVATLQVFIGTDKDFSEHFDGMHEIMVNDDWDMDVNFDYMFEGDIHKVPYILANYTVVDPTTAVEGKNAITLTTYMPYEFLDTWHWEQPYNFYLSAKENMANILIQRAQQYVPDLSDHIEVLEVGSPVTNYAYSLNPGGTIFGWANTPEQSTLRRLAQQTPIDNLVLAGAWTFPGGGQSAVISSGVGAADIILEKIAEEVE